MSATRAALAIAVGTGLAVAATLRHATDTSGPGDKQLGQYSAYFSINSQVKLVSNPAYQAFVSNQLQELRSICDALADAVAACVPPPLMHHPHLWSLVKMVAAKGGSYEEAAARLAVDASAGELDLRAMVFKDEASPEARLVQQVRTVPEWVDPARLRLGKEVFDQNAIAIGTVLLCGSLVLSYACKNGNKVLLETRRLTCDVEAVWRRLAETWHFVLSVMQPDGLHLGGPGYDAAVSVRLLHAIVRRHCLRKEWNYAEYGHPINQEDMLGTLAAFSACALVGLEKSGIRLTREEQDAYIGLWQYVGYLVGLNATALDLVSNYASSRFVGETIALRQLAPDENSAQLTTSSLLAVENHYTVLRHLPKPFRCVISFWCRWLLGNPLADAMRVPKARLLGMLLWLSMRIVWPTAFALCRGFPLFRRVWIWWNLWLSGRSAREEFGGRKRIAHPFKTA